MTLRVLRAATIIASWFKALSYTRAFEQTAFITRMLLAVFSDMKYFFLTMAWILYGFTFAGNLLLLLFPNLESEPDARFYY